MSVRRRDRPALLGTEPGMLMCLSISIHRAWKPCPRDFGDGDTGIDTKRILSVWNLTRGIGLSDLSMRRIDKQSIQRWQNRKMKECSCQTITTITPVPECKDVNKLTTLVSNMCCSGLSKTSYKEPSQLLLMHLIHSFIHPFIRSIL